MARQILIIVHSNIADTALCAICPKSVFRFIWFQHRNELHDEALIKCLAGFRGDILIDRDVRLGGAAIEAIRARLGRGKPPTQLALLPRLHIKQKLPEFIGGWFEEARWEGAQKAFEIHGAVGTPADVTDEQRVRVEAARYMTAAECAEGHRLHWLKAPDPFLEAQEALLCEVRARFAPPASMLTPASPAEGAPMWFGEGGGVEPAPASEATPQARPGAAPDGAPDGADGAEPRQGGRGSRTRWRRRYINPFSDPSTPASEATPQARPGAAPDGAPDAQDGAEEQVKISALIDHWADHVRGFWRPAAQPPQARPGAAPDGAPDGADAPEDQQ